MRSLGMPGTFVFLLFVFPLVLVLFVLRFMVFLSIVSSWFVRMMPFLGWPAAWAWSGVCAFLTVAWSRWVMRPFLALIAMFLVMAFPLMSAFSAGRNMRVMMAAGSANWWPWPGAMSCWRCQRPWALPATASAMTISPRCACRRSVLFLLVLSFEFLGKLGKCLIIWAWGQLNGWAFLPGLVVWNEDDCVIVRVIRTPGPAWLGVGSFRANKRWVNDGWGITVRTVHHVHRWLRGVSAKIPRWAWSGWIPASPSKRGCWVKI